MWDTNPWSKWGVSYTTRDGAPVLTETELWFLWNNHPDAVEQVNDHLYWLYLDKPYLARRFPNRAYLILKPDPFHKRAA